jgi:hypothetical protein
MTDQISEKARELVERLLVLLDEGDDLQEFTDQFQAELIAPIAEVLAACRLEASTVYCLQAGDDIECGCSLVSIHQSLEGALEAAKVLITDKEMPWLNQPDRGDWIYVSVEPSEPKVLRAWKTHHGEGYDTVIITREPLERAAGQPEAKSQEER